MWKNRIFLLILWLLSLAAISFYGGPISYGFFAVTTLLPLSALVSLLHAFLFFKVFQRLEDRSMVANHTYPYEFSLKNESALSISGVKVNLYTDFSTITGNIGEAEIELLPRAGIHHEESIICRYRGSYSAGIKNIEVQDYLHLFSMRYKNPEVMRVNVKPELIRLEELRLIDVKKLSALSAPNGSEERDVLLRAYEPGDDTRMIAWKTSARTQELLVRKTIGEEQQGAAVLFSTQRVDERPAQYLPAENKVLETALALTAYFTGAHIPVSMGWYLYRGLEMHRADREDMFQAAYEEISLTQFKADYYEKNMLNEAMNKPELHRCRMVFVVLQKWSVEAEELARALNRSNVSVQFLLITEENQAPKIKIELPMTELMVISPETDLKEVL